jgi:hypothetical protein
MFLSRAKLMKYMLSYVLKKKIQGWNSSWCFIQYDVLEVLGGVFFPRQSIPLTSHSLVLNLVFYVIQYKYRYSYMYEHSHL